MSLQYAVLTPLHNEAENVMRLFEAIDAQTVRPSLWLLIENGSTDATPELARALAAEHSYVRVVSVEPLHSGERGAPIVHALHAGLRALGPLSAAVALVDADVSFQSDYFARLLEQLSSAPELGVVSGKCLERADDRWQPRYSTGASVWGAARVYRRECLEQVLPFEPRTGWDAIDVAKANALGWRTALAHDLPFYHHRPESSRESSRWSGWLAQGRVSYFLGYRPTYLVLRACFRALREPAAFGLVAGYLSEAVHRRPRCSQPAVRAWVRGQQRLRSIPRRAAEARGVADRGGPA